MSNRRAAPRPRRVAVVTGSRAEYGLLENVLRAVKGHPRLKLSLIVSGQHLMREFGTTVRDISRDGFSIAARVPLNIRGDSPADIAKAIGRAVIGFSNAFARLDPDLLLILGDRFEILAAASAALPMRIPVAHIHGGEATEGAIDEQVRNAVTKLSHIHFPAAKPYRDRIVRMGEPPARVFRFGSPGLETIRRDASLSPSEIREIVGAPSDARIGIVTFHPTTNDPVNGRSHARNLYAALKTRPDVFWVVTLPGLDAGSREAAGLARRFAREARSHACLHASLGRTRYLSLLRAASVVVGNSSSGLLEAPSFGVPTVNVGSRQGGRLRAASVIDVPSGATRKIAAAVARALSPTFSRKSSRAKNPYEGGRTAARIADVLACVPLGPEILLKRFHDGRI